MDTKGNLYINNPDGSTREVIPPDQVVTPEPQADNWVKMNRHERRKSAAIARRNKKRLAQ